MKAQSLGAITELVAQTIEDYGLLRPLESVLVAFSGGPDSTASAVLLERLGYRVSLHHIDHTMRRASADEARAASEIATQLALPFSSERVLVTPPSEEAARRVRYHALQRRTAGTIATGHTLDDEAETVLMRLTRGGAPHGIPPRRGPFVRPLIRLRRSDTERVCRGAGVTPVRDTSNADVGFTRNLVRLRVLPAFPDSLKLELARLGERSRRERVRFATETKARIRDLVARDGAVLTIDRPGLIALDRGYRRGVLRAVIEEAIGGVVSVRALEQAVSAVDRTGAQTAVGGGVQLRTEPARVLVGPPPMTRPRLPLLVRLPGRAVLQGWGLEIEAAEADASYLLPADPGEALLDADRLHPPLFLRTRLPGDRLRPLGMRSMKKLQDVFVDRKVPRSIRDSVPLLVSRGEIAWVVGHVIDDRFKITRSTSRAVHIALRPHA